MVNEFKKSFKTYEELLVILEDRNLPSQNRERGLNALRNYGYYRLSAYWYPFRIRGEDHVEGVDIPNDEIFPGLTLDDIIDVYEFDRELRHVLVRALDQIELSLRVAIAYQLGQYDQFAFENIVFFSDSCTSPSHWNPEITQFDAFRQTLNRRQAESKEVFVQHFEERYNGRLPVWVSIETWDFGTLNACFEILRSEDRIAISETFGIPGSRTLGSWLGPFRVVRNMCAHHSRLNRRHFTDKPRLPQGAEYDHVRRLEAASGHRLYPILIAMIALLRKSGGDQELRFSILDLARKAEALPAVRMRDYGFPDKWSAESLWSIPLNDGPQTSPHSRRDIPAAVFKRMLGHLGRKSRE